MATCIQATVNKRNLPHMETQGNTLHSVPIKVFLTWRCETAQKFAHLKFPPTPKSVQVSIRQPCTGTQLHRHTHGSEGRTHAPTSTYTTRVGNATLTHDAEVPNSGGGGGGCGRRDWQKMRKNVEKMRKMRQKMR